MKNQEKNFILVTGGAGFIGSHSVDLLLSRGFRVRVLDNLSAGRLENLPIGHPGLEFVNGDVLDTPTLHRCFSGVTHVLHLAAQVSVVRSLEEVSYSCEQNILGFVRVLEQSARQAVRLVYASSAAVYGNPEYIPLYEESAVLPISPYGLEKYANELYAELYGRLYGMKCMGLRYFNVFGPRQDPQSPYSGVISRFIHQAKSGEKLTVRGDGLQARDFIHVRDVARANVAALLANSTGMVNIARGESITILTLAELVQKLSGSVPQIEWVPETIGDIRSSRADITRMLHELCAPEYTLRDGLSELVVQQ